MVRSGAALAHGAGDDAVAGVGACGAPEMPAGLLDGQGEAALCADRTAVFALALGEGDAPLGVCNAAAKMKAAKITLDS